MDLFEQGEVINNIQEYIALLKAFLRNEMSPIEFELLYLHKFKNDSYFRTDSEYQILNDLFCELDSLDLDSTLSGDLADGVIVLQQFAHTALEKLQILLEPKL